LPGRGVRLSQGSVIKPSTGSVGSTGPLGSDGGVVVPVLPPFSLKLWLLDNTSCFLNDAIKFMLRFSFSEKKLKI
jgi:hypothetical protein